MHDFIQTLSFQPQQSPTVVRSTTEALRSVMRSFDSDVPFTAYRPVPRVARSKRRGSKSLNSQPSALN